MAYGPRARKFRLEQIIVLLLSDAAGRAGSLRLRGGQDTPGTPGVPTPTTPEAPDAQEAKGAAEVVKNVVEANSQLEKQVSELAASYDKVRGYEGALGGVG